MDAYHLAEPVRERLRICRRGVFSDCDVQLSIRCKMDRAAIVIRRRREIVEFENNHFAVWNYDVAIRSEAADAIVSRCARDGVVEIKEIVICEVWIESDSEQPAFTIRIDIQRHEGCGE